MQSDPSKDERWTVVERYTGLQGQERICVADKQGRVHHFDAEQVVPASEVERLERELEGFYVTEREIGENLAAMRTAEPELFKAMQKKGGRAMPFLLDFARRVTNEYTALKLAGREREAQVERLREALERERLALDEIRSLLDHAPGRTDRMRHIAYNAALGQPYTGERLDLVRARTTHQDSEMK